MEILAIALSGLLSVFSGGGVFLDRLAGSNLRSQVVGVERQLVRIDNVPSYQIVGGKIQKVRIATRGLQLKDDLRIEALELETDAIALKRSQLNFDDLNKLQEALQQPLQGAVRIVLTEADLNRVLQSPKLQAQLQASLNRLVARRSGSSNITYNLKEPHLELLSNNRLKIQFKLTRAGFEGYPSRELAIALKLGIKIVNGKAIEFIEPSGTVNQRPMSSRLLQGFARGVGDRLNLTALEADGILARLLQLEISQDKIELAGFARMETKQAKFSSIRSEFSTFSEVH
jgi:hypothetical protein